MDLIVFHYHLLPGGVTDVIVASVPLLVQGLAGLERVVLVCGRVENSALVLSRIRDSVSSQDQNKIELEVIPDLDYAPEGQDPGHQVLAVAGDLLRRFGKRDNIWWIHNYHLGKNLLFTRLFLKCIRDDGPALFFQIHDFPESSRYANLSLLKELKEEWYPLHPRVRYGVINHRDASLLSAAGMPEPYIVLLQNPVLEDPFDDESLPSRKMILDSLKQFAGNRFPGYRSDHPLWINPVRTIRRKNIMESALLCWLVPEEPNLLLTLPGVSSQEQRYSGFIESAFEEGIIPGIMGTGVIRDNPALSLSSLIKVSNNVISSSVQEGFGYLYLNSLRWKKPLIARSLPVLSGWERLFHSFPVFFYNELMVSLDKDSRDLHRAAYRKKVEALAPWLDEEIRTSLFKNLFDLFETEWVDFSYLTLQAQKEQLVKISRDPGRLLAYREKNREFLTNLAQTMRIPLSSRSDVIREEFGPSAYLQRFRRLVDSFDREPSAFHLLTPQESQKNRIHKNLLALFADPGSQRLLFDPF